MLQLILHLIGDYVTQSDWMAQYKTSRWLPAVVHAGIYSLPFAYLAQYAPRPDLAFAVIFGTHLLIDRFRLARYVVWAKNFLEPIEPWHRRPFKTPPRGRNVERPDILQIVPRGLPFGCSSWRTTRFT